MGKELLFRLAFKFRSDKFQLFVIVMRKFEIVYNARSSLLSSERLNLA